MCFNLIDKCTVQQLKGTSPAAKKLFEWLTQASGSKGILDDKVFQVNSLRAENFLLDISSGAQVAMVELFLTQAFGV